MSGRVRIGVDVDGVLANMSGWVVRCVNQLRRLRGLPPKSEADVTEWDYLNLFDDYRTTWDRGEEYAKDDYDLLWWRLRAPGCCIRFKPYPHARELVKRLGGLGDVWLVTTPMPDSDSWAGERIRWAKDVLGVDRHRVMICSDKSAFDGRVLIDDRAANLQEWEDGMADHGVSPRRGILWRQAYSGPWAGWWTESVEGAVEAVRYELSNGEYAREVGSGWDGNGWTRG